MPPPTTTTRAWPSELTWVGLAVAVATGLYLVVARNGLPAASGLLGHGIGIFGFVLMLVAQLAYSWRKHPDRAGPGPLRAWMRWHVFAGIVGPYLVLLHTAFEFRGLAGVLTLVMLVVVASGIIGRYVYTAGAPPLGDTPQGPRPTSLWYLLHVPLSAALFALAAVHVAGVLYYSRLLR
jgi:hypothetical protein